MSATSLYAGFHGAESDATLPTFQGIFEDWFR
jgi:hypothetical protein